MARARGNPQGGRDVQDDISHGGESPLFTGQRTGRHKGLQDAPHYILSAETAEFERWNLARACMSNVRISDTAVERTCMQSESTFMNVGLATACNAKIDV